MRENKREMRRRVEGGQQEGERIEEWECNNGKFPSVQ